MVKMWPPIASSSALLLLLAAPGAAWADEEVAEPACEAGTSCAEAKDEAASALMQLRSSNGMTPQTEPCSTFNMSGPFCCHGGNDCNTCKLCSKWNQCDGPATMKCSGCKGPWYGDDGWGVNINNGRKEPSVSPEECRDRCATTRGCIGYTWKTDTNECWLKDCVERYEKDELSVSGTCHIPRSVRIMAGEKETVNCPDATSPNPPPTPGPPTTTTTTSYNPNPAVDCDTIDKSQPFCCWWPQDPVDCATCEKCTAGTEACSAPGDAKFRCSGISSTPYR